MPRYVNGRARRITKIRVDEISEVDRPANGIPFLLYKREDGAPAAASAATPSVCADLAKWGARSSVAKSMSADYDGAAVAGLLASVAKRGTPDPAAPGDGTLVDLDGEAAGLTAEDYAREVSRIDAAGVAAVNSPKFHPNVHVPSAVDVTDPVPV